MPNALYLNRYVPMLRDSQRKNSTFGFLPTLYKRYNEI